MTHIISITQTKGGATKTTTSVNILGALLERGQKAILCDMDKDKPDAIFWADLGNTLNNFVIKRSTNKDGRNKKNVITPVLLHALTKRI